jgi:hypothetical protein
MSTKTITSTLTERVLQALKPTHPELAAEFAEFMQRFTGNVQQLLTLQGRQTDLMREFIYTVQSRCRHSEWYLCKDQATIACVACGHSITDKTAYQFGVRVLQGQYTMLYGSDNPRHFRLNPFIRKQLGARLLPEDQYVDVSEEALRKASTGAGTDNATPE